jgi:hypothetical protein
VETLLQHLKVSAHTVPTDLPASDGTIAWDITTLVLVESPQHLQRQSDPESGLALIRL